MAAQTEDKKLDGAGLSVLWGLIKNIIPTVPTNVSSFTNDASYVSLLDTHNKNLVLASPSGAAGLPSFRALVASDIPDLSGTYLTSHQSIKSLTLQGDGTTVSTFTANSAALTFNFKAGSNISLTRGTNEITIANTYSYSHPTGGANTTIAAANGKVLSAITVNNLGHVTSVSSKTLVAADIPDLSGTYLTGHQSIYALKIQGDGTDVTTYTPNSATKTFNLKAGSNITLTRGTNEITIAGTANTTYTIATGDADGQIKVTPSSGSAYNVSVKGLGSNAYSSTAYLPLSGASTITGRIRIDSAYFEAITLQRTRNGGSGIDMLYSNQESKKYRIGSTIEEKFIVSFIEDGAESIYFTINKSGNVGIGTYSPSYKLHVNGTVCLSGINFSNDTGVTMDEYGNFKHKTATATNDWHVDKSDGTRVLSVMAGGNVGIGTNQTSYKLHVKGAVGATAFTNTSDIRNKDFVSNLTMDIEQIANAPMFKFRWKTGEDKDIKAGSSAQYWNMVLPETVSAAKDEQHTLSMQYDVIALLSAITIAKEVVNDKERIRQLEQRVSQLEAQLAN